MADRFRRHDELLAALDDRSFDRSPALVCNAHITALGVARALAAHDIPVIALDRNGDGVAPSSDAVTLAGEVTYPLDDQAAFGDEVASIASALDHDPVAFGCMDEWVLGLADTRPEGVRLPFSADRIDDVLDKTSLYAIAEELDVPYPETYLLRETATDGGPAGQALTSLTADGAADRLGFPLVVKPALKRAFEETIGTNVVEVDDRDELQEFVSLAREEDIRIMAQERVPVVQGADRSYVSYVGPDGETLGMVGNPTRYPAGYGTSCLVERRQTPVVADRGREVLEATGYHGISEAEFVYDGDRDAYVLLDVNTRPWKWIGLPVQAGVDLPFAAYADSVGREYVPDSVHDATWVYLRDYLALLAEDGPDQLSRSQWVALLTGGFEDDPNLTTGVYAPSDPGPAAHLIETEFSDREYYCAC
ncbi:MAG: carboxylate--amine ligase [Halodesulfurarchaeum sp.]